MFSHILVKCSATELSSDLFNLTQSLIRLPRLALNLRFSHLCLQSSLVENRLHLCDIILIFFPLRCSHTQLSRQVQNLVIFLPLPNECQDYRHLHHTQQCLYYDSTLVLAILFRQYQYIVYKYANHDVSLFRIYAFTPDQVPIDNCLPGYSLSKHQFVFKMHAFVVLQIIVKKPFPFVLLYCAPLVCFFFGLLFRKDTSRSFRCFCVCSVISHIIILTGFLLVFL